MKNLIINTARKWNIITITFLLTALALTSCIHIDDPNDPDEPDGKGKGEYAFQSKYNYIRSYPEGGGVFIVYITPGSGFAGDVKLSLEADPALNATLTRKSLNNANRVAEIAIRPRKNAEIKKYTVTVRAEHAGKVRTLPLEVDMFDWTNTPAGIPLQKRDEFKDWVIARNSKYAPAFAAPKALYHTYPEILIVEHFSYLTNEFEVRFCYHVMVPPDDWSLILIRRRGAVDAEFAARRESDGTIHQIQVPDYPILLGY